MNSKPTATSSRKTRPASPNPPAAKRRGSPPNGGFEKGGACPWFLAKPPAAPNFAKKTNFSSVFCAGLASTWASDPGPGPGLRTLGAGLAWATASTFGRRSPKRWPRLGPALPGRRPRPSCPMRSLRPPSNNRADRLRDRVACGDGAQSIQLPKGR